MPLKDDLIAAKALIDSPEKWQARGRSIIPATRDLSDEQFFAVKRALTLAAGLKYQDQLLQHLWSLNHADIMALFDRAIEAAP